jgi:16S rRNA (cytosine1402-N4)-methyltransferase
MYHKAVMLSEVMQGLAIDPAGTYVDTTFGGGGHARAILDKLDTGRLYAFDQDIEAAANVPDTEKVVFLNVNFRYMRNFLKLRQIIPVDGILADLGVSSHQIDSPERGFSTRFAGPLDMRMNHESGLSARDVVNTYDTQQLAQVFRLYGELKNAGKLAAIIEAYRSENPIETTSQLADLLMQTAPRGKENKYLAQAFQALRIEVNQELDALRELLEQSTDVLRPGGRLVVISYHSLEDRLVKNYMRAGNFEGKIEKDFFGNPITPLLPVGKSQQAGEEEIQVNPRARSARLRVAAKRETP